jgi:Crinkler effector protein N-terminal domain
MMFRLFCYVRGDDSNWAFKVEIGNEESVSALKEAIKEKKRPKFDHIPADSIFLWAFPIRYNENLRENVEWLDLDYHKLLEPLDSLSDIFSSKLEKKSVHVIVDRPPPGEFSYAIRVIKSSRFQQRFSQFHPNHSSSN